MIIYIGKLQVGDRFRFNATSTEVHEVIGTQENGLILCRNVRTYATSHQCTSTSVIKHP